MNEKVTPAWVFLLICGVLLVLTLTTYEVAFIDLGRWNIVVALAIAALKASLVALFFMNARFTTGITRVAIAGGLLWLGILIAGTMDDLITRGWLGVPGK
jgi:cytochrome c oxidase subunit 4